MELLSPSSHSLPSVLGSSPALPLDPRVSGDRATGRMQRLRRSFSLDFVNDDTATVFLNEDPDHEQSAPRGSGSHHNHHHSLTTDPKCLLVRVIAVMPVLKSLLVV